MKPTVLFFTIVSVISPIELHASFIESLDVGFLIEPGNADAIGSGFSDPISPFENCHFLELLGSTAGASYDFDWGAGGGVFQSSMSISVLSQTGIDRRVSGGGLMSILSDVPFLISGNWGFDYDLPSHPMSASLGATLSIFDPIETLGGEFISYSTTIGGPDINKFQVSFEGILIPAQKLVRLRYSFVIDTDDDVPISTIATGVGSAHFEIVAVPEPSAALLVVGAVTPMLVRRRRRALADLCD